MMTTEHPFVLVDVFTDEPFGGNPLAVFPDATAIPERALQKIAFEIHFSETTFVYPNRRNLREPQVRIFTPLAEIPFAGHPTVGTAAVLARREGHGTFDYVLHEGVGPVPVHVTVNRSCRAAFKSPQPSERMAPGPGVDTLAAVLSLRSSDFTGEAVAYSAGLPFLFVPLVSRDAVSRCRLTEHEWERHLSGSPLANVYPMFIDQAVVHARMFAPGLGVREDPATGSAAAALAGYLVDHTGQAAGEWTIRQGEDMGRPSVIRLLVEPRSGQTASVRIDGDVVWIAEGQFRV